MNKLDFLIESLKGTPGCTFVTDSEFRPIYKNKNMERAFGDLPDNFLLQHVSEKDLSILRGGDRIVFAAKGATTPYINFSSVSFYVGQDESYYAFIATKKFVSADSVAISVSLGNDITSIISKLIPLSRKIEDVSPELVSYLKGMEKNVFMLLNKIQHLSRFNMLSDTKSMPLILKKVNFSVYLRELLSSVEVVLKNANYDFRYTIESSMYTTLDLNFFTPAIIAIINNCTVYANDSKGITITAKCEENKIVIQIADNGRGISPAEYSKIFEPYFHYREDGIPHDRLGLGLSVAKLAIEQMNGDIGVVTSEQAGTVVTITLPEDVPSETLTFGATTADYLTDQFSEVYVGLADISKSYL